MHKYIEQLVYSFGVILLMTIFWLGFSPAITFQGVLTGFLLSIVVKKMSDYLFRNTYNFYIDFKFILYFIVYLKNLLINIFKSAFIMIPIVIYKQDTPIIFNIHLSTLDPLVVTLVANAITLTPGTITLETGANHTLTVLSIEDDGNHGKTIAEGIIRSYEAPFSKTIYRGDQS